MTREDLEVKTLANALDLLDQLVESELTGLSIQDLATKSSASDLTVYRTLNTLESHGYVTHDARSGSYTLSRKWLRASVTFSLQSTLRRIAIPYLVRLVEQHDVCASIAVEMGYYAMFIDRVMPPVLHGSFRPSGGLAPWHSTAAGKAIAAFQRDDIIDQYLREHQLVRSTPNTITDPDELKHHFAEARCRGWTVDDCENLQNTYCLGAPVYAPGGKVTACISMASKRESFIRPPGLEERLEALRMACSSLSGLLGYL